MYEKVLLPLDGTQEAEHVIPLIKDDLSSDTEVVLLRVIPHVKTKVIGQQFILGSQQEEADRSAALSYLKNIANQQGDADKWDCDTITAIRPHEGIALFAQQQGVDLIAMYAQERKGLARFMKRGTCEGVKKSTTVALRLFGPQDVREPLSPS